MKNALYIILVLMFSVSSVAAQRKSTKEWEGLNGAVHTVRIESFVLLSTSGEQEPRYGATIYTYDTEGYKTKEEHLMADGSLSRQIFFTYDAQNRIAEEADYLSNGSLREKTIYTYDNKTAEAAVFESADSLSYKVIFKFDLDYDLNDLAGLQGVISFHRKGLWMEAAQYDSRETLLQKFTAVNKYNGREITLETLNNSTEAQRTNAAKLVRIYDSNGNLIDRYLIAQDTRIEISEDNETAEPKRTPNYELDENGNWTKKVFLTGRETQVEYRTITYYGDQKKGTR